MAILSVGLVPLMLVIVFTGGFGLTFFLNTPHLVILLMGLYLYGTYLYIWKNPDDKMMRRMLFAVILLLLMMLLFTIDEFVRPQLPGPMMWAIVDRPIDYPSMWFDNWRLWWICMLAESALLYSSLILYIVMVIRCLYLRLKQHKTLSD